MVVREYALDGLLTTLNRFATFQVVPTATFTQIFNFQTWMDHNIVVKAHVKEQQQHSFYLNSSQKVSLFQPRCLGGEPTPSKTRCRRC